MAQSENTPNTQSSRLSKVKPLFESILDLAFSEQALSAPMLQRRYTIGFNRATRLMDALIELGVVAKEAKDGKHKVLIEPKDVSSILNSLTK